MSAQPTEAAREAAKKFIAEVFDEDLRTHAMASRMFGTLAQAFDAHAVAAVKAERERIMQVIGAFSLGIPDPYDVSAAWALENVVRKIKQTTEPQS